MDGSVPAAVLRTSLAHDPIPTSSEAANRETDERWRTVENHTEGQPLTYSVTCITMRP